MVSGEQIASACGTLILAHESYGAFMASADARAPALWTVSAFTQVWADQSKSHLIRPHAGSRSDDADDAVERNKEEEAGAAEEEEKEKAEEKEEEEVVVVVVLAAAVLVLVLVGMEDEDREEDEEAVAAQDESAT